MEISSEFVGRKSKPLTVTISERDAMNYCAGCYVKNPIFYEDYGKLLVFPLFVVSLTWKISSSFDKFWDTSGFPLDALSTQVHYFEDLTWYKCIYAGDSLTICGEVYAIFPHISGTLLCIEYIGTSEDGTRVFRELTCSLLRGVKCLDKGGSKDNFSLIRPPYQESNSPLSLNWEDTIYVDLFDLYIYDGCSGIHFPIHTSRRFAFQAGLNTPIYQGTAILGRVLERFFAREEFPPEKRLVNSLHARFSSYVTPGTKLSLKVFKPKENSIDTYEEYYFWVEDSNNRKVIKDGKIQFSK